jgi:hypothetical protein
MTEDEVIKMAEQSNLLDVIDSFHYDTKNWVEEATAFAKLVAAKKQEDIIQIIKETPFSNWFQADVIEAIKARGEQA